MGNVYQHLTIEERCELARLHSEGYSKRQIAAKLDRSPSTISRELNRNSSRPSGYQPSYADDQAWSRRWRGSKLDRDSALRHSVYSCLQGGWSPEQVAGRLALEAGHTVVSHETIYRFIQAQIDRRKDYTWRNLLPRRKAKRGHRGRKGDSSTSFIRHRQHISLRPADADHRATPGHWEADLMLFGNKGQSLLTLQERYSRLLLAYPLFTKDSQGVADAITQLLAPFPPEWRQSVTFDNGTEFARHYQLHDLCTQTFFCDPRSPWQKGGVENANGRLRPFLPRKTNLSQLPPDYITRVNQAYNHTPRKCLGFLTPAEISAKSVLHLKCESTFPPTRERRGRPHPDLPPSTGKGFYPLALSTGSG